MGIRIILGVDIKVIGVMGDLSLVKGGVCGYKLVLFFWLGYEGFLEEELF